MRVVLSPIDFDPQGPVVLDVLPGQKFGELRRRMNRVATLDGGAVFNDYGYSESDRTVVLRWRVRSKAQEQAVQRLLHVYARVHVATPEGFFLAGLELYTPGPQESALSLLVANKLA